MPPLAHTPLPLPPSQIVPEVPFFATKVQLGPDGISKVLPLGAMNEFETAAMAAMVPQLKGEIQKGLDFGK